MNLQGKSLQNITKIEDMKHSKTDLIQQFSSDKCRNTKVLPLHQQASLQPCKKENPPENGVCHKSTTKKSTSQTTQSSPRYLGDNVSWRNVNL